jgi:hypothetical protein
MNKDLILNAMGSPGDGGAAAGYHKVFTADFVNTDESITGGRLSDVSPISWVREIL